MPLDAVDTAPVQRVCAPAMLATAARTAPAQVCSVGERGRHVSKDGVDARGLERPHSHAIHYVFGIPDAA